MRVSSKELFSTLKNMSVLFVKEIVTTSQVKVLSFYGLCTLSEASFT